MGWPEYRRDLLAVDFDANRVLDRYFHSGESAAFWQADPEEEPTFKRLLAQELRHAFGLELHPFQLIVCGSAHLGFSPVPKKLGNPFNPVESDIDVAVVSSELFDRWWTELQQSEQVPVALPRVAEDLFWGFINPVNVNSISEIGRKWWDVFGKLRTDRAKGVRGRLYRSYWSMQIYHKHAIDGGRKKLQGHRV